MLISLSRLSLQVVHCENIDYTCVLQRAVSSLFQLSKSHVGFKFYMSDYQHAEHIASSEPGKGLGTSCTYVRLPEFELDWILRSCHSIGCLSTKYLPVTLWKVLTGPSISCQYKTPLMKAFLAFPCRNHPRLWRSSQLGLSLHQSL